MINEQNKENAAMTGIVIHNAQDIIDALEKHPEFLEQVRNHILTKRLLELPDQVDKLVISVDQLAETVAILADRVRRLEERTERIEERQEHFDERQQRFDERQQRFEDRQHGYDSQIRGDRYQNKALRQIGILVMTSHGLTNPRIIATDGRPAEPEWHRMIQLALNSRDLSPDDISELNEADIILIDDHGRPVVAEASVTAAAHDVSRARHRADLLTKAAGQPAIAVVLCAGHSQDAEDTAQAQEVALLHMRE